MFTKRSDAPGDIIGLTMYKKCIITCIMLICITGICCAAGLPVPPGTDTPAFSALDLLKPDMFPNAQFGMAVESVQDGSVAKVVTTGGEFVIDKARDSIECKQRISKQRTVATIQLAKGTLKDAKLTNKGTGMAIFSGTGGTVRINGDSLLMVQPKKSGNIKATLAFVPDFHKEFYGNYNFFDPDGGISFLEHGKCPDVEFQGAYDPVTVTWPWKGGDVFWAGVSPPKPYDWDYPVNHKILTVGTSEDRYMYPTDLEIALWKNFGLMDILYLHYEMMWNHWNLDLTPKNPAGLRRVVNTSHERSAKVMIYISPHYFVKGTAAEAKAHPDPHYGSSWHTGSNARLYLDSAAKVVKDFGVDGLYWDGMYEWVGALATNYWLSRAARELMSDDGILVFHATTDVLGGGHLNAYCPTQHAYFDAILKGEGEENLEEPGYLRYIGSTHNLSNSAAFACIMTRSAPTKEQVDRSLRYNMHLIYSPNWSLRNDDNSFFKHYWPRLKPSLKDEISDGLSKRTGTFDQWRNSIFKR